MFVGSQALKPLPHLFLVSSFNICNNIFSFPRVKSDDPNCPARKNHETWGGAGRPARRSDDLICRKSFCTTLRIIPPNPLEFLALCTLRKLQRGEFPQNFKAKRSDITAGNITTQKSVRAPDTIGRSER